MMWKKHVLLWLLLILVAFIAMPLMLKQQTIMARVMGELQMIQSVFGAEDTAKLTHSATVWYNAIFVDTGLIDSTSKAYVNESEKDSSRLLFGGAVHVADVTNGYLLSFAAQAYAMMIRLFIILSWLPYIFPFMLAVIIDGTAARKIKLESFGFSSPIAYSLALHAIIVIVFFPAIYLLLPIPVTPLFMPFWALAIALPVSTLIGNTQRVSGN
jgi:hypothetical protein